MKASRRDFLQRIAKMGEAALAAPLLQRVAVKFAPAAESAQESQPNRSPTMIVRPKGIDARAYLKSVLYTREEVEQWIIGRTSVLEKYDGEIGWIPHAGFARNGIDGCTCEYSYDPSGARRMTGFADRECRINTYGDSFTHCDQVSNFESWQERLASHLCEPVRNFGVSGNTLYQAYTRMKREEMRTPAKYLLFNLHGGGLWGSESPWASLGLPRSEVMNADWREPSSRTLRSFGGRRPTVPYVTVNPATGDFVEHPNICPTADSLYNLCDFDWVYEHFKNEDQLKVILARENIKRRTPEASYDEITALAQSRGIHVRIASPEDLSDALSEISKQAAIFMNQRTIEKIEEYAAVHGKRVFYLISHSVEDLTAALRTEAPFDQRLVDFLAARKLTYVDDLDLHRADFARSRLSPQDYLRPLYIGHYTPFGNFFQAFAIKDNLIQFLDPRPIAYSE